MLVYCGNWDYFNFGSVSFVIVIFKAFFLSTGLFVLQFELVLLYILHIYYDWKKYRMIQPFSSYDQDTDVFRVNCHLWFCTEE